MSEHEVVISFDRLASLIEAESMLKAIEKYLSQKKDLKRWSGFSSFQLCIPRLCFVRNKTTNVSESRIV